MKRYTSIITTVLIATLICTLVVKATTITTINGTDTISGSRTTINTNFSNLNSGKAELSGDTFTGLVNFSLGASVSTKFEVVGYASASAFKGSAFPSSSCTSSGNVLRWSTTGAFTCASLAAGDIPSLSSTYLPLTGGTLSGNLIGTTASLSVNLEVGGYASVSVFLLPQYSSTTLSTNRQIALNSASGSMDWNNTSVTYVDRPKTCRTFVMDSPTSTNPSYVGPLAFDDPATIVSVGPVYASGSNAVGWNLKYGKSGSITTSVFSSNKSASSSTQPVYTSFTNSSIGDGMGLELIRASASATLQSFSVPVCFRYTH